MLDASSVTVFKAKRGSCTAHIEESARNSCDYYKAALACSLAQQQRITSTPYHSPHQTCGATVHAVEGIWGYYRGTLSLRQSKLWSKIIEWTNGTSTDF